MGKSESNLSARTCWWIRLGELLALKWKHINFDEQTLRVQQSLWGGELQTPKTASSVRTVPFGTVLAKALTDQMQTTTHIGPEDFVFAKADGGSLHPDVVRKDVLYPALDRLGIKRGTRSSGFHAFRHAAASLINARTGDLKLGQKLLGHSTLAITADVYTHTYSADERRAATELERAIFENPEPTCSFPVPLKEQEGDFHAS